MLPGCAVRIPEVGKARAAMVDSIPQHFRCRPRQGACLSPAERVAAPPRIQAGVEQDFTGVNVADTGDPALVQKECFEISPRARQLLPEPCGRDH